MKKGDQRTCVGVVAIYPLRLLGLRLILEEDEGLVTRAASLEEALVSEDLVLVVLDFGCVDGVEEALIRFRHERPAAKVVVFGEGLDPDQVQAMIAAGAKGYLPETATEEEIRMAMKVVLDGSVWAPRKVLAKLIEAGGVTSAPGHRGERFSERMTHRELEVLRLLQEGQTNRQIAEAMGIESVTVKAHVGRMLRKAGVKNRVELTLKAMAEGVSGGGSQKRMSQAVPGA
jgi:DNA-binding NarL/FixJ family response regulator